MIVGRHRRRVLDVEEFVRCAVGQNSLSMRVEVDLSPDIDDLAMDREAKWRVRHPEERVGPKFALRSITRDSAGDVTARLGRTNWARIQGWQEQSEEAERGVDVTEGPDGDVRWSWNWPNAAVVHVLADSEDGQILTLQRSAGVRYHPLAWSTSYEEGLEEEDLKWGDDVFRASALRGLSEELMGPLAASSMDWFRVVGVIAETQGGNPAVVLLGNIPLSAREIESRLVANSDEVGPGGVSMIPSDDQTLERLLRGDLGAIGRATPASASLHPTSRYRVLAYRDSRDGG